MELYLGLCLLSCIVVDGYVFDANQAMIVQSSETSSDSSFGYGVDLLRDGRDRAWLFAGAPKDRQDNIVQGSLSACNLDLKSGISQCSLRYPEYSNAKPGDDIRDQMLGATVLTKPQSSREPADSQVIKIKF